MSIFNPIVATKMKMNSVPIFEAPTPSNSRALVNESITPIVVDKTINQKNWLIETEFLYCGVFCSIHGAMMSAAK